MNITSTVCATIGEAFGDCQELRFRAGTSKDTLHGKPVISRVWQIKMFDDENPMGRVIGVGMSGKCVTGKTGLAFQLPNQS